MTRQDERSLIAEIKPELLLFDTDEINAETPAHLLDDEITPIDRLFVRNTGRMPVFSNADLARWTLRIDGAVQRPATYTLSALQRDFQTVDVTAVLECAGNGRAFFTEPTAAPPWRHGAAGCVRWSGVRLADLLRHCGLRPEAVYTGHYSPDVNLTEDGPALSRGIPIAKALSPETLIAFAVNGQPLPVIHGGPIRVVAPGFPGSAWQKWISRIAIRDREHDGERMTGEYYRMPRQPIRPGETIDPSTLEVITDMPVRSVITSPAEGFTWPREGKLEVRGFAWGGHVPVERVELSIDDGEQWQRAWLAPATERFAWRRFRAEITPSRSGPLSILARATDANGNSQPLGSVPWNPRGYLNNAMHRVSGVIE